MNRLISAAATGGASPWTGSWSYDGFGNRLTQTIGGATTYSTYNTAMNRLTGLGNTANYYQHDANGNMTQIGVSPAQSFSYDVENRMMWAQAGTLYTEYYGYAADNKRVYKKRGDDATEEVSFYLGNKKLGAYQVNDDGYPQFQFTTLSTQLWFGGKKLAVRDRLGSKGVYYPFGEERGSAVQNDDSFATYYRDKTTALDYADQRYYSALTGRFVTPDPYQASGGVAEPGSWNRYAYVEGDPVNFGDPRGLLREACPFLSCSEGGDFTDGWGSDSGGWFSGADTGIGSTDSRGGAGSGGSASFRTSKTRVYDAIYSHIAKLGTELSSDCLSDLGKFGIAQTTLTYNAARLRLGDITSSGDLWSGLYLYSASYSAALHDPKNGDLTIAQWYKAQGEQSQQVHAATVASSAVSRNGPVVYIDPSYFNGAASEDVAATVIHELIHAISGAFDDQIQLRLFGPAGVNPKDTSNITKKLREDCIK